MTQKVTVKEPFNYRHGANAFHFARGEWAVEQSCGKESISAQAVAHGRAKGFIEPEPEAKAKPKPGAQADAEAPKAN
ncbi:hypothetical protein D9M68_637600 [compost metagenome]